MHPKTSEPFPSQMASQARTEVAESDTISLRDLIGIARSGAWTIAAFAAVGAVLGGGYALLATPTYESQALVHIEKFRSAMPGLESTTETEMEAPPAATEIEIMRSRQVLGPVVDALNLQIHVKPARFPVVGSYLARRYGEDEPAPARFGASEYAWGGERVQVERFEVAKQRESQEYILKVGEAGAYSVHAEGGDELVDGLVGEVAVAERGESGDPALVVVVSELKARPGTRFRVARRQRSRAIARLRSRLSIRERGMGTGIVELKLEGEDPGKVERVLNQVAETYVRQHVESRSADARNRLEFLEEKLPELRAELEASEEALSAFRRDHDAVDLGTDARNLLGQIVDLESQLVDLDLERMEKGRRFTSEHPVMRTLAKKERKLRAAKSELERRADRLPSREQEALRLRREVDVARELYTSLRNTAEELRVVEASTTGNAKVLDPAVKPQSPAHPRRFQVVAVSTSLALMLGLGLVYGRQALRRTVRDPDALDQTLGLPVYSVIPHSVVERRASRRAKRRGQQASLLAAEHPMDPAVEGLRDLRTSLHLALLEEHEKVIALTSPHDESGTSFVAMNEGYLLAQTGLRVLVIDADLRHGRLHEYSGRTRRPGLSEVLSGQTTLGAAVRVFGGASGEEMPDGMSHASGLYILATGSLPSNPSELLMGRAMEALLEEARSIFDLVILDTPPLLAVTDGALASAHAGAIFMLVRAGRSEPNAIEAAVKRLRRNNIPVTAVLFNDMGAR